MRHSWITVLLGFYINREVYSFSVNLSRCKNIMTVQYDLSNIPLPSSETSILYESWMKTLTEGVIFVQTKLREGQPNIIDPLLVNSSQLLLRKIRNTLIGNLYLKITFIRMNLAPILRDILSISPDIVYKWDLMSWHVHSLVILGTLAKSNTPF